MIPGEPQEMKSATVSLQGGGPLNVQFFKKNNIERGYFCQILDTAAEINLLLYKKNIV